MMNRKPISVFLRLMAAIVIIAVVVAQFWPTRGPVVTLGALAFYGALLLVGLFEPDRLKAWSRLHPVLDAAIIIPAVFLALCLFDIRLALCAAIAVAAGAVFVPLVLWRRRSEPPADDGAVTTLSR